MILKERLEELIKQGATIYAVYNEDRMEQIKLVVRMMGVSVDEYNKIHNCQPMLYSQFGGIVKDICPISWLFETEEEAEWYKEFGCIEKPQYLKFPNWKQIESFMEYMRKFGLNHNDRVLARIITSDSIYYFKLCKDLDIFTFQLKQTYIGDDLCEQISDKFPKSLGKATKENYTLACRKCKELFLGENK